MTDPRLLIPLANLPGPWPEGAPGAGVAGMPRGFSGLWLPDAIGRDGWGFLMTLDGGEWRFQRAAPGDVCADLSPPPLDPNGYPLRIDGADVGAAMLSRSDGLEVPEGGIRYGVDGQITGPARFWISNGYRTIDFWLAGVQPVGHDACRLALAATLRARPWRT